MIKLRTYGADGSESLSGRWSGSVLRSASGSGLGCRSWGWFNVSSWSKSGTRFYSDSRSCSWWGNLSEEFYD